MNYLVMHAESKSCFTFLEPSAKLIISLQLYSSTEIKWPGCKIEFKSKMLSKVKSDKMCKQCKSNFNQLLNWQIKLM